jgi:murein DD-endopeptidase MepM/ murein hydrolase activator NlpD
MRKIVDFITRISIIVLIVASFFVDPMLGSAESKATTLAGLRKELSNLQYQKQQNQQNIQDTQSQINKKNQEITQAYNDIETAKTDIQIAQSKIEASDKKIQELKDKNQELLKFYESTKNNDLYLQYATGASTLTDLIMRIDAIKALANYNQDTITAMQDEIDNNNQLKVDLANKQTYLNQSIDTYQNKLTGLRGNLTALTDNFMDLDEQIKSQKQIIASYEKMGCKENQDLGECERIAGSGSWLKPVNKGTITSGWGARWGKVHYAVDIGIPEGTTVYSVASGRVTYIVRRGSCGGNQVYVNVMVAGKRYTVLYAHLLQISVSEDQQVTSSTVIGVSGGRSTAAINGGYDKCAQGAHLHFSVSNGYYGGYNSFIANNINPPGFPAKGGSFYSRTQWFG